MRPFPLRALKRSLWLTGCRRIFRSLLPVILLTIQIGCKENESISFLGEWKTSEIKTESEGQYRPDLTQRIYEFKTDETFLIKQLPNFDVTPNHWIPDDNTELKTEPFYIKGTWTFDQSTDLLTFATVDSIYSTSGSGPLLPRLFDMKESWRIVHLDNDQLEIVCVNALNNDQFRYGLILLR